MRNITLETKEKSDSSSGVSRKDTLKMIGIGVISSLISKYFIKPIQAQEKKSEIVLPELPPPSDNEDVIITMMRDLQKALQKPMEERHWVMVIDTRKCVGCHACTISCVVENKLPPGTVYRPVMEQELGTYPNVSMRFIPRPCMQCSNAPCVGSCPVNATWIRKDGIVEIDYEQCIGCRYCISACPYGARVFDSGFYYTDSTPKHQEFLYGKENASEYEKIPNYEYGIEWKRTSHSSPIGNARKCQFCLHRIELGLLPMCVVTCIGRATYFGDLKDPDSLIAKLASKNNQILLKEELGTKPNVIYLI